MDINIGIPFETIQLYTWQALDVALPTCGFGKTLDTWTYRK